MKYVLFDLDGTLTDPGVGITSAVMYAAGKMGFEIPPREELYGFIGPPLRKSFAEKFSLDEAGANIAVQYYREYYRPVGIFECRPYPGIIDSLEALCGAGYKLAIATAKPEIFAKKIAEHFNIDKYFEFISGSTLDGSREDKAEIILRALENVPGSSTKEAVMIGDRDYDIKAAKTLKMKSIGAAYGYGSEDELINAGADRLVFSAFDISEAVISLS